MPSTYSGALSILKTLKAGGHEALLAGGCVRDRLRGVEPLDYDIATSALPHQVQAAFPVTEAVGAAFGVVLVIQDGAAYEVATFRTDGPYLDGRRPAGVRFAGREEDARRRDFTVNGMFYDPDRDAVLDFVGGRGDLDAGLLRAIGAPKERFAEDRLRVLRCVRFACQLGFRIEPSTWDAAKAQARDLEGLAFERIGAECTKILRSPRPRLGLELLDEAGLLASLLPELVPLKGCPQPLQFHPEGDVWEHTLRVVQALADQGPRPSAALAWAALLHDVGKPATKTFTDRLRFHGHEGEGARMVPALLERMKLGRDLSEAARVLVADHLRLVPLKQMKLSTLKRLLRREDIEDLLALHRADCLGSHGDLELYELARRKREAFAQAEGPEALRPEPLLDGADLIAWGYVPGPAFKAMLECVEDEQLEGRLTDREGAKRFVEGKFPKGTDATDASGGPA